MAENEFNGSPVTRYELNLALQPLRDGYRHLDTKLDEVLDTLAENRGADRANRGFLDSRWRLISTIVLVLTSSIATTTFTLILRSHQ